MCLILGKDLFEAPQGLEEITSTQGWISKNKHGNIVFICKIPTLLEQYFDLVLAPQPIQDSRKIAETFGDFPKPVISAIS